jgi:ADP-heptose:LPS heptosyltransferase
MRSSALSKWLDFWVGIPLLWVLSRFTRPNAAKPIGRGSRVLVIKFSAVGDTLLLLPLLKAIKEAVGPEGHLAMVGTQVNQAVLKNAKWLPEALFFSPARALGLILELRRQRFDLVIDFDQWLRSSAVLALCSGAKLRAGFRTPGQHQHFGFHLSVPNHKDAHEFEQFKELLQAAGLPASKVEPYEGFLKKEGFLGAEELPRESAKLVVLHPGTGGKRGWQREWPIERFAELSRWLRSSFKAKVAVSGAGAYEEALCAEIPSDESCVNTGLKSLVRTLCRADLLVCGNTGVMHLAAGLGTPVLALHGPNPHVKWGPLGPQARVLLAKVSCSPCLNLGFEFGCPQRPCMESISVDESMHAAKEMLA